jgi:ABC-2 type transport system permease protein
MKWVLIPVVVAAVVALRVWGYRRRHQAHEPPVSPSVRGLTISGSTGLVAAREVRERLRGRVFRVGTVIILLVVAGAIVIPVIISRPKAPEKVGVVGSLSAGQHQVVLAVGKRAGVTVHVVTEASLSGAEGALRAGRIDLCLDGDRLLVNKASAASDTYVEDLADELGVARAYTQAGISPTQAFELSRARPLSVVSLQPSTKSTERTTSLIGVILIFIMLTQYLTWTLMGVMEEKSSRVVEVLLATVRPLQLLTGKVLGIGLVAMGQAVVVVLFALVLAKAVGSSLLHGTAPVELLSVLVWLVLGYAFYCWVYAAAGSTVERQDQVQTLALPLSLPMILGYVLALTTAGTGSPSLFFEVLAYVPLTAPFAMPILVGLARVQWWEFVASVLISLAATAAVARLAAAIYRRAILRTGGRVRIRDVIALGG